MSQGEHQAVSILRPSPDDTFSRFLTPVHVDVVEEPATSKFKVNELFSGTMKWKEQMGKLYRTEVGCMGKVKELYYRPGGALRVPRG